jgi:tyrosyl-tRNA synthetase
LSLQERGLVQDFVPGLDALLEREKVAVYAGFDPTADSLHIGNLVPIMLLVHFQRAGHRPIALVGGATGRVGDPTGRSAERNVLSREQMEHHLACQQAQLKRFLDFDPASPAAARLVNNEDWFGPWTFLDFIADVGRHIPINYMLAKDSVKLRLENGMSFMEFCYQLIQGYDFVHLHRHYGCKVQVGGSDQKGAISGWILKKPALTAFINFGSTSATTRPVVTCPSIRCYRCRKSLKRFRSTTKLPTSVMRSAC